jgi:integrase
LRRALWKHLNQSQHAELLYPDETKAIAWLEKASRPVSALKDEAVVCDVLDVLATNLDGTRSAPEYFSRRRRALHRALAYAIRKKRLDTNPLSMANLPDTWTPPDAPDDAVNPRSVGTPELTAAMLVACSYVGRTQGPRFAAFFGCMYYAMMRPSEVAALTEEGCHLPETGWGHLTFADASPAAGKAFTDDGQVHEHRGLKGATKADPTPPRAVADPPGASRSRPS